MLYRAFVRREGTEIEVRVWAKSLSDAISRAARKVWTGRPGAPGLSWVPATTLRSEHDTRIERGALYRYQGGGAYAVESWPMTIQVVGG